MTQTNAKKTSEGTSAPVAGTMAAAAILIASSGTLPLEGCKYGDVSETHLKSDLNKASPKVRAMAAKAVADDDAGLTEPFPG